MNPGDEWEDPGNTVMNVGSEDPFATAAAEELSDELDQADWVDPGQPAVGSNPFWPDL